MNDTVAAVATAPGRAGLAVVRVSGDEPPELGTVLSALDFTEEMAGLLDGSGFVGTETVPQARLDAVFDDHARPDDRVLLKIDTQGTERQVLDGARGVLHRITALQIELSIVPVYRGEPDYLEMIRLLDGLEFQPVLFIPGYFNRRTARLIGMDGVFVRRAALS